MSWAERRARRRERRAANEARLLRGRNLRARHGWAAVIQASAFVRKEMVEILRQPKLLALLVGGPFALLLLFGAGYQNTTIDLRTVFVAADGSLYEESLTDYADQLDDYVDYQGFTNDEDAALRRLADQDVDVVVVFPDDAIDQILGGDSAVIEIIHNKIDPFQRAGVSIAARLAVQEVNASVLSVIAEGAQRGLGSVQDLAVNLTEESGQLADEVAAADPDTVAARAGGIADVLDEVDGLLTQSRDVIERLGGSADDQVRLIDRLEAVRREARAISQDRSEDVIGRAEELSATLEEVAADIPQVATISPSVLVRPFQSRVLTTSTVNIKPADFFTPSSLVLLLQHLALTFAALSLVRDRQLGLFELLRVGPLSSVEILVGKTIAYLVVGLAVGAALMAASVYGLGVPFLGSVGWAAVVVAFVLLASLAMGLVMSLISGTETQAVQYAMLSLLAGMFFSGFILDIQGLAFPVRYVAYALPVTYGISSMHDIMLRGLDPSSSDLLGLGALILGYGGLAVFLLRRRLRQA